MRNGCPTKTDAGGLEPLVPLSKIPTDAISVEGCLRLWCEVIGQQWRGALPEVYRRCGGKNLSGNARLEVRRCKEWFGSSDFFYICGLAGVDADAILKEFQRCMDDVTNYRGVKDAKT